MADARGVEIQVHAPGVSYELLQQGGGVAVGHVDGLGMDAFRSQSHNLFKLVQPSGGNANMPSPLDELLAHCPADARRGSNDDGMSSYHGEKFKTYLLLLAPCSLPL